MGSRSRAALVRAEYSTAERQSRQALSEADEDGNDYLSGKVLLQLASAASLRGQLRQACELVRRAESRMPGSASQGQGRASVGRGQPVRHRGALPAEGPKD